jgi:hypothetical protein
LTADHGIEINSSTRRMPLQGSFAFDPASAPGSVYSTPSSHDVTVEAGAKLKTKGSVNVHSDGGRVDMNGLINAGGDVNIASTAFHGDNLNIPDAPGVVTASGPINARSASLEGATININAPIHTVDSVYVRSYASDISNSVRAEKYEGDINQRANVTASTGSVNLFSSANIIQADGVKTSAGTDVTLKSQSIWNPKRPAAGGIRVANVQGKTIDIDGGDVTLAGTLKADGNISVQSRAYSPPCPLDSACIAVMAGGHLSQTGNVTSSNGDVMLNAEFISQQASSLTKAGNNVTLSGFSVDTGRIQAGKRIAVDAFYPRLGGTLTAPEISLPANTKNTEGNIRILPKSANL